MCSGSWRTCKSTARGSAAGPACRSRPTCTAAAWNSQTTFLPPHAPVAEFNEAHGQAVDIPIDDLPSVCRAGGASGKSRYNSEMMASKREIAKSKGIGGVSHTHIAGEAQ